MTENKPSVCLVTCYRDPGYIRVKTLEAGLIANDCSLFIVRNKQRGVLRYAEVVIKLVKTRFSINPDVYIVTFRGYEILPFVLLIGIGKKIVFDEFINLVEWTVYEHKKIKSDSLAERLLTTIYRFLLNKTTKIITDTNSHAEYSARLMNIPISKYQAIPVGTDEMIFKGMKPSLDDSKFQVMYYGSMLPLHGVEHVIQTAIGLKDHNIEFLLIGGNAELQNDINDAIEKGANIKYKKWVPFAELPQVIANADVCLGGPFGNTVQSQFVITGKTVQFLRMGKPVIVGRNKESNVFDDKVNVLIVNQADPKSLGQAIVWSYKNQKSLEKIGENGTKLYDSNFSSQVVANCITKLLDSI